MADGIPVFNAITWAQFRLSGGWKRAILLSSGYFSAAFTIMIMMAWANPRDTEEVFEGFLVFFAIIQGLVVLVGGCHSVQTAVRKDVDGDLLDSHRLMPISGLEATLGYAYGSTVNILALAGTTFILGLLASAGADLPLVDWLTANAVTISFALCIYPLVVLLALMTKRAIGVLFVVGLVVAIAGQSEAIPALLYVCPPLTGFMRSRFMPIGVIWNAHLKVGLATQVCLLLLALYGASRKYRRNDVLPFSPWMALLIPAGWTILSAIGVAATSGRKWSDVSDSTQLTLSQLSLMLIAMIPLYSMVVTHTRWKRRKALNDPALPKRTTSITTSVIISSLLVAVLPLLAFDAPIAAILVATTFSLIAALAYFSCVAAIINVMGRRGAEPGIIVTIWTLIAWIGPPLIDLMRWAWVERGKGDAMTVISACSPIGTFANLYDYQSSATLSLQIGLIVQVILAFVITATCRPRPTKIKELIPT